MIFLLLDKHHQDMHLHKRNMLCLETCFFLDHLAHQSLSSMSSKSSHLNLHHVLPSTPYTMFAPIFSIVLPLACICPSPPNSKEVHNMHPQSFQPHVLNEVNMIGWSQKHTLKI